MIRSFGIAAEKSEETLSSALWSRWVTKPIHRVIETYYACNERVVLDFHNEPTRARELALMIIFGIGKEAVQKQPMLRSIRM